MHNLINDLTYDILNFIKLHGAKDSDLEPFVKATIACAYAKAVVDTKEACKEAIKPFIYQHIVVQELRDLYLSKIDGA